MEKDELFRTIILSSEPLRKLNEAGAIIDNASGVIVNYYNKKLLLTVHHAILNSENWNLEIKTDFKNATKLQPLKNFGGCKELNIETDEIVNIDLALKILPFDIKTFYQPIDDEYIYEEERIIHDLSFITPSTDRKYGFYGQTEFIPNGKTIIIKGKIIFDLSYIGEEGQFYKFKLPFEHPGHSFFRGTSGAPIIDDNGKLVSLVCKGKKESDYIYGINLLKYKPIIDMEVDNIYK